MERDVLMKYANHYEILIKALKGIVSTKEASCLLGKSYRQTLRLKQKARDSGIKGLFYQRRHCDSKKVPSSICDKILKLRRAYADYNLSHFRDTLQQDHEIVYSREFYRKLLQESGLHQPHRRRRKKILHRKRFEAPQAGLLVQRDTSIHFWVPDSDRPWKLILDLDDHSRTITGALFSLHDDVTSNLQVTGETISRYGLPLAYYTDNNPIFNPVSRLPKTYQYFRYRQGNEEETLPQFKRALQELGIQMIHATPYQPQGKGKIERIFRFLQDRLLKEMAHQKVHTLQEANRSLKHFVTWYNTHWVHGTTHEIPLKRLRRNNAFRAIPKQLDLVQILCLKFSRVVKADNTIQMAGRTYQIPSNSYRISYAKAPVEARVYLDGKMQIFHKNRSVAFYRKLNLNRPEKGLGDILALQRCDNLALR
jgi:transposase InsO family protein